MLFVQLLLPIAGVAVAEVNFPAWSKAVDTIYPRAWKMANKPRHVLVSCECRRIREIGLNIVKRLVIHW